MVTIFLILFQNKLQEIVDFFFDELVAGGFLVSFVSICTFLTLKKNRDLLICLFFLFF